jgi:hypothetical protein
MNKPNTRDMVIARIWDNLDRLQEQLTSSAAEGLKPEQLDFVNSRLSDILDETSRWFTVQ